jgi:hypothetical protein
MINMSYKYGTNGNDLNWDFLVQNGSMNEKCVDCRKVYDKESKTWEYPECEGHTTMYSQRGWALFHNTNTNTVYVQGNVPLDVYNQTYLKEWLSDFYIQKNMVKRIWEHLTESMIENQHNAMDVIAYWGMTNTSSLNVYAMIGDSAMLVGVNNYVPEWKEIDSRYDNESDEVITSILTSKGKNVTEWNLNECMKV